MRGYVIKGFRPIVWTSDHWSRGDQHGYTKHKRTIGYVPASLIGYAVYRTAILRDLPEFRKIFPIRYRIPLHFRLRAARRAREPSRKLKTLVARIDRANQDFDELADVLRSPRDHRWKSISGETSNVLVELNGLIATGEIERALRAVQKRVHAMADNQPRELPDALQAEASGLCERVYKWKAAVKAALID